MLPGGEGVQLEECRAGVDEQVDALPGRELAARAMALGRALAAARGDERRALAAARRAAPPCGPRAPRTRRRRDRPCSSTPSSHPGDLIASRSSRSCGVSCGHSEGTRRRRQRLLWRVEEERASGGPVCGGPGPPPLGEAEGAVCALQTVSPSREHTPVGPLPSLYPVLKPLNRLWANPAGAAGLEPATPVFETTRRRSLRPPPAFSSYPRRR